MALPIAPIALVALRYGAVALTAYAVARAASPGAHDQRAEDAMDDLPEGLVVNQEPHRIHAGGRFRRTIRIGSTGPGIEIDAAGLGRVRWRRV